VPERKRTSGPLLGLRVLELAAVVAGPTAGQLLADLGADVVKVEPPAGDAARRVGAAASGPRAPVPLWWKHLGRNKRSIGLDLAKPDGREVLLRLVDTADVLIESFRAGTLERWGLSPESLLQQNERLVLARISGFGRHGPLSGRPAFGTLVEAMSGFASINGAADGPPTLPPISLADYLTGYATATAVLAALHARDAGLARGQVVEASLLRSLLSVMSLQIMQHDQTGAVPGRTGSRMPTTAPRNVYETADRRFVAVSGTTPGTAGRLMELVGRGDLAREPWFGTGAGRYAHVDELDEAVAAWAAGRSLVEVLAAAERAGVTLAPVYDVAELLADEGVLATGAVREVADTELGEAMVPDVVCELSATPGAVEWLGEAVGGSTDAILRELSFDPAQIAGLRRQGVVV
jgi:crotonobetainyl-CoA:carnitine CoA-transferase CaiB-like acyl-CoA transferase